MLIINFSVSWINLESSCFCFPQMPRKMTKFVLNDLFEDIKLFLEKASSTDQIKSSRLCFSPWSSTFESLRCYTMSAKNLTVSLTLLFPKKAENAQAFLHILLTSRKKIKIISWRTKISARLFPYSSIFHNCAQTNLCNCIVCRKKGFAAIFWPWIHYFHQDRHCSDKVLLNNYDETITLKTQVCTAI